MDLEGYLKQGRFSHLELLEHTSIKVFLLEAKVDLILNNQAAIIAALENRELEEVQEKLIKNLEIHAEAAHRRYLEMLAGIAK